MRTRCNKQLLLMMMLFILATWLIRIYFGDDDAPREDEKRLHNLNIQSRMMAERGTGCRMPKTHLFAADIMKYVKETPKVYCPGTDWVECIDSQCHVIKQILDSAPTVECYYSDIIYVNDNEYYIESPRKAKGPDKYILHRSDHVHVYCIKNTRFPFSWWSESWRGLKTGLRHVEIYQPKKQDSYNILVLGIDSVSHNQFLRKLPFSYNVLTQELGGVVLNSYNILGDGTPAALFPILTGKSELEMPDARKINRDVYFQPQEFLFGQLHIEGYHTAYFEDSPETGTFQYRFNGFRHQPADHYLRPFFLEATEKFCVGAIPKYALMLNLTQQFIKGKDKRFCFTFIADICHDDPNLVATMEDDLSHFLKSLKVNGVLENTLLIVMADHGPRFSNIRSIYQGMIEERLPFMAIVLPEQLKKLNPAVETYLRANADVLTTPFDIHTTMLEAVGLNQLKNKYYVPGSELPRGMSLLKPIPPTRSCAEADVLAHWCACLRWVNVSQNDPLYKRIAIEFAIFINGLVAGNTKCAKRELIATEWVFQQKHNDQVFKGQSGTIFTKSMEPSVEHFQVKIVMSPGRAMYESTMMFLRNQNIFLVSENDISRVNAYGEEPKCISQTHPHLNKYCYCVT